MPDRDYYKPAKVAKALADNGAAAAWIVAPVEADLRIVKTTGAEVDSATRRRTSS